MIMLQLLIIKVSSQLISFDLEFRVKLETCLKVEFRVYLFSEYIFIEVPIQIVVISRVRPTVNTLHRVRTPQYCGVADAGV